jgi:hypothetical protein
MIRNMTYRPRDPNSDDLEERYRGFVSLPKMLLARDEARNLEAERWAAGEARAAGLENTNQGTAYGEMDRPAQGMASHGARLAQAVIPIPRVFPALPPLFYDRGGRGSPPRGPCPQSRRKSDGRCEEEYARNLALCDSYYPKAQFPGLDLDPRGRKLCKQEAFRVFSDCETGRKSKPFDPMLFYEE